MIPLYEYKERNFDLWREDDIIFPAHLHHQVEICYVLGGTMTVVIDDITQTLCKGDIAIVLPNHVHSYESPADLKHIILTFSIDFCSDFNHVFSSLCPNFPFLFNGTFQPEISRCMEVMSEKYDISHAGNLPLMRGYLNVLLSLLFDTLPIARITVKEEQDLTSKVLNFMLHNYKSPICLLQVARHFGVSRFEISRVFSNKINISFCSYLNALRINHACHLLLTTILPMTDISFESGFESPRTFYRVFHEVCSTTPIQYRNNKSDAFRLQLPD